MARKPMVTRTMSTTNVSVLCLNVSSGVSETKDITLPRIYANDKQLLKEVRKILDTDTLKAVHIIGKSVEEKLYGMTENEFLLHAIELDPITRRPLDDKFDVDEEDDE